MPEVKLGEYKEVDKKMIILFHWKFPWSAGVLLRCFNYTSNSCQNRREFEV